MEITGIGNVAAITVICFLIAQLVKNTKLDNKWLPVICGFCGGLLGVLGQKIMSDFPAQDLLTAIAVGIVSGLAATGTHQIYKQFTQIEEEIVEKLDE